MFIEHLFKFSDPDFLDDEVKVLDCFFQFFVFLKVAFGLGHALDDDSNDEVQDDQAADDDEGDKIDYSGEGHLVRRIAANSRFRITVLIAAVHLDVHQIRPVFECRCTQEGNHTDRQTPEMDRIVCGKHGGSDNSINVN